MPAEIVPVKVPLNGPVPVLRERLTPIAAPTFLGIPFVSCDWTTTAKAALADGLEPPLTDAIASFVGGITALYVTIAAAHLVDVPNVPVALYAPVALTNLYSGSTVILLAALPWLVPTRPIVVYPLPGVNVSELFPSTPIIPSRSSDACVVVAVEPEDGDVLPPMADAVWSSVLDVARPENSFTLIALEDTLGWLQLIEWAFGMAITLCAERITVRTPLVPEPFVMSLFTE